MAEDLEARLRSVDKAYMMNVLAQVEELVCNQNLPSLDVPALLDITRGVLKAVTDAQILQLTSDRLEEITDGSHADMIAVCNPSVRKLKRRPGGEDEPRPDPDPKQRPIAGGAPPPDEIADLLDLAEGYASYKIGDLVLDLNPYFSVTNATVTDQQIIDAGQSSRQGGPFVGFHSGRRWDKGDADFNHIPHPDQHTAGFDDSWYMLTRHTPKSLPNDISTLPSSQRSRLRNVIKTVEVEYGVPIDTGDGTTTNPKVKIPHIFVMYAGGNGT